MTAIPEKSALNPNRNGTSRVFSIFDGRRSSEGNTLMELIVTLSILGMLLTSGITLGIGIYDKIANRRFNDECDIFLDEILAVRNAGMMIGGLPSGCKFYHDSVLFYHYNKAGKRESRIMTFETFTIKEVSGVLEIRFDITGTISKSTTLTLISENGKQRQLIFQPVTGRIYLTDGE